MRRLRLTLDGPVHADGDPYDDGPLPDLTSGLMWVVTAIVGLAVQVIPGTDHSHIGWVVGLATFGLAWGVISILLATHGMVMPIARRAVVTAAMMPVVALALWATGGATSYLQPVLLFTALFVAWFFPPPLAWPLVALFAIAYASPIAYDPDAVSLGYPARAVVFAVSVTGLVVTMQYLKRRLVHAEVRQRAFAELDPLTSVSNRRGFDQALARTELQEERYALVLFDFDHFKAINDAHGHPAGDEVLRAVADAASSVIRQGDTLARIGGDEFALIAPGAGWNGVARLVNALGEAIEDAPLPDGIHRVGVTFAWAVAPDDASDAASLVDRADERLLARKREGKRRTIASI